MFSCKTDFLIAFKISKIRFSFILIFSERNLINLSQFLKLLISDLISNVVFKFSANINNSLALIVLREILDKDRSKSLILFK